MAVKPLSLILINLDQPADLVNVDLPKPAPDSKGISGAASPQIKALYGDPTGKHLLISVSTGDVFYLSTANLTTPNHPPRKVRPLRLRHSLTCVAWSPCPAAPNTAECLLGSPTGAITTLILPPNDDIFNLKSVSLAKTYERDHNEVYALDQGVTGIAFGFLKEPSIRQNGAKVSGGRRVWLTATTQERIYQFEHTVGAQNPSWNMVGKAGWADEMFKSAKEQLTTPKFQELPGNISTSMLSSFWSDDNSRSILKGRIQPQVVAWLATPGLYHFSINQAANPIFNHPDLMAYPPQPNSKGPTDLPLAVLATEYHFVLLFKSRIIAMSRLSGKILWEEQLSLRLDETPQGLVSDMEKKTFWFYTNLALYEIVLKDEDRDVWKAKLDGNHFEEALFFAKTAKQKDLVKSRQADNLFDQKRYLQAAQHYAECSRSFEFVALRFIEVDEKDALRIYLSERLNKLPKQDLTQRMMLATWLIEIYLSKCNTLEDIIAAEAATSDVESLRVELSLMDEDLRSFLTTYQVSRMIETLLIVAPHRLIMTVWYQQGKFGCQNGLRVDTKSRSDGDLPVLCGIAP